MSKKNGIEQLSSLDFVKMVAERMQFVSAGSDAPAKKPEDFLQNRLAAALHPAVQYLIVQDVIEHSPDMKSYILSPDPASSTKQLAWFSAGQYLSLEITVGDVRINRPYSIASSPRDTLAGSYQITVKRVQDGLASNYILDKWQKGTRMRASAPLGEFTYEPLRDAKTVVGIAGGSGITPFRSMAKAICEGDEDFDLVLLYGSRVRKEAVFSDEIAAMASQCPRIRLVNVLSESKARGCEHGFITADLIRKYAPEDEAYSVFLCGPQAMYTFMDTQLSTLGLRRKFVRRELFGEVFHPENNSDYTGDPNSVFTVTVHMAGKTYSVPCKADTTLLRAMEKAGVHAPSDCRSGTCGWCHAQLLSGDVYIPQQTDGRRIADKQYGYIHPCCTFPLSDLTIDVPPMG